jgi:two-component system, NarL family, invasion response regulator UvrY
VGSTPSGVGVLTLAGPGIGRENGTVPGKEASISNVETVQVLIVDDQPPFRAVARTVVGLTPGFEVVAEAASGEEAVELAHGVRPGLVLMDINLPGTNGIDATRRILAAAPSTVVILLSTYDAGSLPPDALDCGAARYVHKEDFSSAVMREAWQDAHGTTP